MNKINVSMFERLIRAPVGHEVPNGVLSVQRRMRRDVCDLTREYYKDIVAIEDHDVCRTKTLPGEAAQRSFWKGREVPGVPSHIYLWTHQGVQSKADVGLSKINKHEANLCVYLAYYLVACGVERKSIAMLTPYKGQLMLMRKILLQDKSKGRLLAWDNAEPDQIRLSTVDRFQGDEGDVIIISLVVDENSRTPFVKLVNRMIVLLSRARLGMYVLGNVGYFENQRSTNDVKHWMRTFEILQSPPADSDNNGEVKIDYIEPKSAPTTTSPARGAPSASKILPLTDAVFQQPRVGSKFPLCCPQHPLDSCIEVDKAEDLKLGFCAIPCEVKLPCSHSCNKKCHWPQKQHNQACKVETASPCGKHSNDKITCASVFQNAPGVNVWQDTIEKALEAYRCPKSVKVELPCSHEEKMACWVEEDIAQGAAAFPACSRPSPTPYLYPDCQHTLDVSCQRLSEYTQNPTTVPKCVELVNYVPEKCDHSRLVKCYLEVQYRKGTTAFNCPERLSVPLPRCGHTAKVSCAENIKLLNWAGTRCDEQDTVREGVSYGAQDHVCREKVKFVRSCGHESSMTCENAFLLAARGAQKCTERVNCSNPYCLHQCSVPCSEAKVLAGIPPMVSAPVQEFEEGSVPAMPTTMPRVDCKKEVTFKRRCGHIQKIKCGQALKPLPRCLEKISVASPLCGHEISVPCHLRDALDQWRPWGADAMRMLTENQVLLNGVKPTSSVVPGDENILQCVKVCKKRVTITKACGHTFQDSCGSLVKIVQDNGAISKGAQCSETVKKPLKCGHPVTVSCKRWQQYEDGKADIPCKDKVEMACWNVEECRSGAVIVACASATAENAVVCCDRTMEWVCPAGKHTYQLPICSKGTPVSCPECRNQLREREVEAAKAAGAPGVVAPLPHTSTPRNESLMGSLVVTFGADKVVPLSLSAEIRQKFWAAQMACLQKFQMAHQKKDIFDRPQFKRHIIPVLYDVASNRSKDQQEGFAPMRDFVKQSTLNGILLHRLTAENIRGIAKGLAAGNSKTFLFGFAYTLKPHTGAKWPGKKTMASFVTKWKQTESYDCVEFEQEKNGEKRFVLWEPHPLYATHRLGPLSNDELVELANVIENVTGGQSDADLDPSYVEYAPPAGSAGGSLVIGTAPALTTTKSASEDEQTSGADGGGTSTTKTASDADRDITQKVSELSGTWAEHLMFPASWDGSTLALGNGVSEKADREMMGKLLFINSAASPFAGKKLLEKSFTSLEKNPEKEGAKEILKNLQLLMALEMLSKDAERSRQHLEKYQSALLAAESTTSVEVGKAKAHPLALLAFARIPTVLLQDENVSGSTLTENLLAVFFRLYPSAAERLLSSTEKEIVKALSTNQDEDNFSDAESSAEPNNGTARSPAGGPRGSGAPVATPQEKWDDLKDTYGCQSDAMDKLMKLTGLKKVKIAAVELFKKGQLFAQMDPETRKKNAPALNYVFVGNPGTGKTTVARLFAKVLHDSGLRKKDNFEEISAQKAKDEGADEFRKKVAAAMDGVLFIDEAYDLDPVGDRYKGGPIANELITTSENERERLTIILAGYEDDMQKKLFDYNPGFKSRFTEVVFEDFDELELLAIWNSQREDRGWREADSRLANVVVRRLVKASGRKGFGNARDVRKKLEEGISRAMSRPEFDPTDLVLEIEDVVGENPMHNEKLKRVLDEIHSKIGWRSIKKTVAELVSLCGTNYERELNGQPPLPIFLNRMFLGNPGTGKTTCARLYGQVLKNLGFLSNGEVVERTAGDIGGSAVGEAKQKTLSLIESSRGKVLMIDEAYSLDDNLYGKQALDTLVEKVQGTESDDIAVLLLGYREPMLAMLRNQNPGLSRRFAPEQAFQFEDYNERRNSSNWKATLLPVRGLRVHVHGSIGRGELRGVPIMNMSGRITIVVLVSSSTQKRAVLQKHNIFVIPLFPDELLQILQQACVKDKLAPTPEFQEKALKKLETQRRSEPNFGNAGSVNNLLKAAMQKATARGACSGAKFVLDACDVDLGPDGDDDNDEDPFADLDKLYRMEHVKQKFQSLKDRFELAEREGDELPDLGHFVFLGAPGTGKTTVARLTAKLLYRLRLISKNLLVETTGQDMTGSAVGTTKGVVQEKLDEARGGVLFIDEAYELGNSQYGAEACTAIVAAMTDEKYAGLVIIMGGYQKDINTMLDTNQGLKSRFKHFVEFPDWAPRDCVDLFAKKARKGNFEFDEKAVCEVLERGFAKLLPLKGWGNARDVSKVWDTVMENRAARLVSAAADESGAGADEGENAGKVLTIADVKGAVDSIVANRMGNTGAGGHDVDESEDPFAPLEKLYRMETVKTKLQQLQNTFVIAQQDGEEAPDIGHFVFVGSPGTGKTTVARVVAEILFRLGLVNRRKAVETSGLDLTGEFLGQTKKKVQEKLDEARGGVLFIDEAYELGKSMYGQEAVTTLVAAMTDPQYKGLVIIVAGYAGDISAMLDGNPGLKSRFNQTIEFEDWIPDDCVKMFTKLGEQKGFEIEEAALDVLRDGSAELVKLSGWGNARDVMDIWEASKRERADRVLRVRPFSKEDMISEKILIESDVRSAVEHKIAARKSGSSGPSMPTFSPERTQTNDKAPQREEINKSLEEILKEVARVEEVEAEAERERPDEGGLPVCPSADSAGASDPRDPGVSGEIWAELQAVKEEERRREEEMLAEQIREDEERKRIEAEIQAAYEAEQERIRLMEEERQREEAARRAREAYEAKLAAEQRKREEAEARRREEARKKQAVQEKLRQISPCPMGFKWHRSGGGWRCSAGGHFVSDAQLNASFTS